MRTLHFLCIKPECSNKPLHRLRTRCLLCGKKINYAIVYGPFIILACEDCFVEKVLPWLYLKLGREADERLLCKKYDFLTPEKVV